MEKELLIRILANQAVIFNKLSRIEAIVNHTGVRAPEIKDTIKDLFADSKKAIGMVQKVTKE